MTPVTRPCAGGHQEAMEAQEVSRAAGAAPWVTAQGRDDDLQKAKKGRPKGRPFKSFRRGCLKGLLYVQCGELLCKCEIYLAKLQGLQS